MRTTNLIRAFAAVSLIASPLAAQGRATARTIAPASTDREGYSYSLGLGAASAGASCTGCSTTRETATSGYLRVGKGITNSLMGGLELNGATKTKNQVEARTLMATAIAQWYPMANNFFVKGGLGMGRMTTTDKTATPTSESKTTGFAYQGGVGYDIGIARRWSVTPYVNYLSTSGAKVSVNGVSTNTKVDPNYMQYGLGLTWH